MKNENIVGDVEIKEIPMNEIVLRENYREVGTQEENKELENSIRMNGLLQPVIVRRFKKGFQLIAGNRRYAAMMNIHGCQTSIPCNIVDCNDKQAELIAFTENAQRKEAHPMEEARSLHKLYSEGVSIEDICQITGKHANYIRGRMRLMDLTDDWQNAFLSGRMDLTEALKVCRIDPEGQASLYGQYANDSKIQINKWMLRDKTYELAKAPFHLEDIHLNPSAGPCVSCQFNSAASLFPDDNSSAVCGRPSCYDIKQKKHLENQIKRAQNDSTLLLVSDNYAGSAEEKAWAKKGLTVITGRDYTKLEKPELDIEDIDRNDFDSDEEYQAQVKREKNRFEKDLKEYEEKLKSPLYQKAVVIDGSEAGKEILVKVSQNKKKELKVASGSESTKTEAPSGPTKEEIQEQIDSIKAREKRAIELDYEKVSSKIREMLINDEVIDKKLDKPMKLSNLEFGAFVFLISDWYKNSDILEKVLKFKEKDEELSFIKVMDRLSKVNEEEFGMIARRWLIDDATKNSYRFRKQDEESHVMRYVAKSLGIDVDAMESQQAEIAKDRAEKVKKKITDLNALLKPKAPFKGKGLSTLLPGAKKPASKKKGK